MTDFDHWSLLVDLVEKCRTRFALPTEIAPSPTPPDSVWHVEPSDAPPTEWVIYGALGDDIYGGDSRYAYVDELQSRTFADVVDERVDRVEGLFTIDLERTRQHPDPLDHFSDVLANEQFEGWIELDPSSAATRARLPWVDPAWHSVQLAYIHGVHSETGTHVNDTLFIPPSAKRVVFAAGVSVDFYGTLPSGVGEPARTWRQLQTTTRELIVDSLVPVQWKLSATEPSFERTRAALPVDWIDDALWVSTKMRTYGNANRSYYMPPERRWLIRGAAPLVEALYERLQTLPQPKRRKRLWVQRTQPDREFEAPFYTPRDELSTKLALGAELRWYMHWMALLEVALVLGRFVPAYVLLWIVDWHPGVLRQPEIRKVRLLVSVVASVRRVLARRPAVVGRHSERLLLGGSAQLTPLF